jgi:hypothetical protein
VNRSTICRAVDRLARRGEATWHALRDAARQSMVNGIDETSWRWRRNYVGFGQWSVRG